uniref:TARBP2 subunit of RISC loading complex n=1 Tax=Aquila chrysaetos chrysaetos TaxID=223781 RepID=A0A663ER52_AQUCH
GISRERGLGGPARALTSHLLSPSSPFPPEPPVELGPVAAPPAPAAGTPLEMKTPVSPPQSECNPVGALQELVVQKGWRLPEYTVTQESGPAHRKEFTMTCRVERFVEIGGPQAGGSAGPSARLHLGLPTEFGALRGAELRHQLPRHR